MSGKDKGKEPISPISNPPDSMPSTSRTSQINEPILAAIQEAVHSAINPIQDTVAQLTETFINRMDAQESQTSGLDRIVTNLQDQINGSGSANRVNQSSTRTAEHDYGHPSGATVPNVTTTPRVPSAVPPSGYNFAGIPRAVQQNPFYHPQQTSGTHVATDPSNPHPDAVFHSESWGSTAHPPGFPQRQPEPPYGIPVSQPPLPPGPLPQQPTPPTGFPQQHLSPPPGFSSQQTAQPSVIPPLQPSSLNGFTPGAGAPSADAPGADASDFSFQQPTGSHLQPGTPHMNNVDPVPLSTIEENFFRNENSSRTHRPQGSDHQNTIGNHSRPSPAPSSCPIKIGEEIAAAHDTDYNKPNIPPGEQWNPVKNSSTFEAPEGCVPYEALLENEKRQVQNMHRQAIAELNKEGNANLMSRFGLEKFCIEYAKYSRTKSSVKDTDLSAIRFLASFHRYWRDFTSKFSRYDNYMSEKTIMDYVFSQAFRPLGVDHNNTVTNWYTELLEQGRLNTKEAFIYEFKNKFVSSWAEQHLEEIIKSVYLLPNEDPYSYFARMNEAIWFYQLATGKPYPEPQILFALTNGICFCKENDMLWNNLSATFGGNIANATIPALCDALVDWNKGQKSHQAAREAFSIAPRNISSRPLRLGDSFNFNNGSSSSFPSAAQFSSPGQSNYSGQNSCHAFVASANDEDQICETCSSDHERRGANRDVESTDASAYRDEFLSFSENVPVLSEADFSEELDNLTSVGDLGLSARINDNDPALFVIHGNDGNVLTTGKFKCRNCNGDHFLRDCPRLEGSGISTVGQAFGSAKGFREGEEPPREYKEAREKNAKRRRAIAAAAAIKRRRGSRGSSQTTAQIRRRSEATNPPKHIYQSLLKEELTDVFNSNSSNVEPRYLSLYARLADADILYFSDVKDPAFP